MIDANDGGVDITHQRRRDLVRAAAADPPVLPRQRATTACRTTSSGTMQDLGTASRAEQQPDRRRHRASATGTPSAAARPATPSPTRPTRTSSTPASTAASSPATTTAPARPATSASTRSTRPAIGAGGPEVPLPVDRPDPDLAARSEDGLPRRQRPVPHHATAARRWDGDQRRPDPQRQERSRSGPAARSPATTPASRSTAPSSPSPSRRSRRACSGPAATTAWSTSRRTTARPGRT